MRQNHRPHPRAQRPGRRSSGPTTPAATTPTRATNPTTATSSWTTTRIPQVSLIINVGFIKIEKHYTKSGTRGLIHKSSTILEKE